MIKYSKKNVLFVGFHSLACFSAKPIKCCIYFRLDAYALLVDRLYGRLVGWSAGLLVCSHSLTHTLIDIARATVHNRSIAYPHIRSRAFYIKTHIYKHSCALLLSGCRYVHVFVCVSVCANTCRFVSNASDRINIISTHTYICVWERAHTHTHTRTRIACHAERWLIYGGLDYPCQWYQLVIPKSQIRWRFSSSNCYSLSTSKAIEKRTNKYELRCISHGAITKSQSHLNSSRILWLLTWVVYCRILFEWVSLARIGNSLAVWWCNCYIFIHAYIQTLMYNIYINTQSVGI